MNVQLPSAVLAAACGVVLLTSCGNGSAASGTASSAASPAGAATPAAGACTTAPAMSSTGGAAGGTASDAPVALTIKDFTYTVPKTVKPGATISITDSDSAGHTVTSDKTGLFDVKIDGGGGTATLTAPTKPGSYPFHCTYHANMHGTLVVS